MNIRLLAACVVVSVVACIPAATAAPPAWGLDAEYAAWKSLYSISYYATVAEETARYKVWSKPPLATDNLLENIDAGF